MKRKEGFLSTDKRTKVQRVWDSKECMVRTFAGVSELVSEVAQVYRTQGIEKCRDMIIDILESQIWTSFEGLESAQDLLGCPQMVRGLDVSIYWLLHLCRAYSFHRYLFSLEKVDIAIIVDFLRTHILNRDMSGPLCADIVLFLFNESTGLAIHDGDIIIEEEARKCTQLCGHLLRSISLTHMDASQGALVSQADFAVFQKLASIISEGSCFEEKVLEWHRRQIIRLLPVMVEFNGSTSLQALANLVAGLDREVIPAVLKLAIDAPERQAQYFGHIHSSDSNDGESGGALESVLSPSALHSRDQKSSLAARSVLVLLLDLCVLSSSGSATDLSSIGLKRGSLPSTRELLSMALDAARRAVHTNNRGAVLRAIALAIKVTRAMAALESSGCSSSGSSSDSNRREHKLAFSNWLAHLFGLGGAHDASYPDLYWDYATWTAPPKPDITATAPSPTFSFSCVGGGSRSRVGLHPEALSSTCYALCTLVPLLGDREIEVNAALRVTTLSRKLALDQSSLNKGKENAHPCGSATSVKKGSSGLESRKSIDSLALIKRAHDAVVVVCKQVLLRIDRSQDPLKSLLLRERATKALKAGADGELVASVSEGVLKELEKKVPQWASVLAMTGMLPGGVRNQATMLGTKQGGVTLASALVKLVGTAQQPGIVPVTRDMVSKIITAMGQSEHPHQPGASSSTGAPALLSPRESSFFLTSLSSSLSAGSPTLSPGGGSQGQGDNDSGEHSRSAQLLVSSLGLSVGAQENLIEGLNLLRQASRVARQGKTLADCGDRVEQTMVEKWHKAVVDADGAVAASNTSTSASAGVNEDVYGEECSDEVRLRLCSVLADSFHEMVTSVTMRMEEMSRATAAKVGRENARGGKKEEDKDSSYCKFSESWLHFSASVLDVLLPATSEDGAAPGATARKRAEALWSTFVPEGIVRPVATSLHSREPQSRGEHQERARIVGNAGFLLLAASRSSKQPLTTLVFCALEKCHSAHKWAVLPGSSPISSIESHVGRPSYASNSEDIYLQRMLNLVLTHDIFCTASITRLALLQENIASGGNVQDKECDGDDCMCTALQHEGDTALLMSHLLLWRMVEDCQLIAQVMPEGAALAATVVPRCYSMIGWVQRDGIHAGDAPEVTRDKEDGVSYTQGLGLRLRDPLLMLFLDYEGSCIAPGDNQRSPFLLAWHLHIKRSIHDVSRSKGRSDSLTHVPEAHYDAEEGSKQIAADLLSLCSEYDGEVSRLHEDSDRNAAVGTLRLLVGSETNGDVHEEGDALGHYHREQARSWCVNAHTEGPVAHPRPSLGSTLLRCDVTSLRMAPVPRALTLPLGGDLHPVAKLPYRQHRFIGTLVKALVSSPGVVYELADYLVEAYIPLFVSVTRGGSAVRDSDAKEAIVAYAIILHMYEAFGVAPNYLHALAPSVHRLAAFQQKDGVQHSCLQLSMALAAYTYSVCSGAVTPSSSGTNISLRHADHGFYISAMFNRCGAGAGYGRSPRLAYEDLAAVFDLAGLSNYNQLADTEKSFRHVIEVAHAAAVYGGAVHSRASPDVVDLLSQSQGDHNEAEIVRKDSALATAKKLFFEVSGPITSKGGEISSLEFPVCTMWLLPTLLAMTSASADQVDSVVELLMDLYVGEGAEWKKGMDRVFIGLFAVSLLHAHSALGLIRSDPGIAGKPMTEKSLCRRFAVKIGAHFTSRDKDWVRSEVAQALELQGIPRNVAHACLESLPLYL